MTDFTAHLVSELKSEILTKVKELLGGDIIDLGVVNKVDNSPVTDLDLYISQKLSDICQGSPEAQKYNIICEEGGGAVHFPAIIIDPLDGTRDFVAGREECCVSLAIMENPQVKGNAWIFNPFTGFEIKSQSEFYQRSDIKKDTKILSGLVSRSECAKGLYDHLPEDIKVYGRGSIAFKLGLLAAGACDFVVTLRPKSIWDIAGGSILLQERGYKLYHNGQEVEKLESLVYKGVLLWCRPWHFERLSAVFRK